MKKATINFVKLGSYLDSVALMQLSKKIANMSGIEEAAVMMGTPANKKVMADAGLLNKNGKQCGGNDMIIAVRANTVALANFAIEEAKNTLKEPIFSSVIAGKWEPKSLRAAVTEAPNANLALISVPGEFAAAEARKAIRRGLHVMIFSDNVSIEEEVSLKEEASKSGLLMMGPDCGTGIINGVPLAFANKVPAGDIGVIGASGTGIQEVTSLIARSGKGISQAIGVGSRDLNKKVGGITTLMALDILDSDMATRHVVIISKPPSSVVAKRILVRIGISTKTFTICFIGGDNYELPGNAVFASTLKMAAELAVDNEFNQNDFDPVKEARSIPLARFGVYGLYSGGTLCAEAQVVFEADGNLVASNIPVLGGMKIDEKETKHLFLDLGSDEYTQGKPHPMIDPSVRDKAFKKALSDPKIGIILFDLVIGFGAHRDPAGHLVELISKVRPSKPLLIASITGTNEDPQGFLLQKKKLQDVGVLVAPSNCDAAMLAIECLRKSK